LNKNNEYHERGIDIAITNRCNYIKFDLNYTKGSYSVQNISVSYNEESNLKGVKMGEYYTDPSVIEVQDVQDN